jgi:hypothetical protein
LDREYLEVQPIKLVEYLAQVKEEGTLKLIHDLSNTHVFQHFIPFDPLLPLMAIFFVFSL